MAELEGLISQIRENFATLQQCYDEAEAANDELTELLRQALARNQELLTWSQELLSLFESEVDPPPAPLVADPALITPLITLGTKMPPSTKRRRDIRSLRTQAKPVTCRCGDWAGSNGLCGPNGCYNSPEHREDPHDD